MTIPRVQYIFPFNNTATKTFCLVILLHSIYTVQAGKQIYKIQLILNYLNRLVKSKIDLQESQLSVYE